MNAIEIESKDIRPFTPPNRCFVLAEKVLGWRWWSYKWKVRGEDGERREARVRSLRPPDFPNELWRKWGDGNDLRPADGTEPTHKCDSTGDAYALHSVPDYFRYIEPAMEVVAEMNRKGWRVSFSKGAGHTKKWTCNFTKGSAWTSATNANLAAAISEAALAWFVPGHN